MGDDVRITFDAVDRVSSVITQIQDQLRAMSTAAGQSASSMSSSVGKSMDGMGQASNKAAQQIQGGMQAGLKEVEKSVQTLSSVFSKALTDPIGAAQSLGSIILSALGPIGITAGVAAGAVAGIGAAIIAVGSQGAKFNDIANGFEKLSGSAANANANLKAMEEGTDNTVTKIDLMTYANKLLGAGAVKTSADLGLLAGAGEMLSHRFGTDTMQVMEGFNTALLRGSDRSLKQMGLTIDLTGAVKKYAESVGVSVEAMSNETELMIKRAEFMRVMRAEMDKAGEAALNFDERIQQVWTGIKNWTAELARAVAASPTINKALADIIAAWNELTGGGATMKQVIVDALEWLMVKAAEAAKFIVSMRDKVYELIDAWKALPAPVREAAVEVAKFGGALAALGIAANMSQVLGTMIQTWQAYGVAVSLAAQGGILWVGVFGESVLTLAGAFATATIASAPLWVLVGVGVLAIGALAGAIYLLWKYWDQVYAVIQPVADVLKWIVGFAIDLTLAFGKIMALGIWEFFKGIWWVLTKVWEGLKAAYETVVEFYKVFYGNVKMPEWMDGVIEKLKWVIDWFKNAKTAVHDFVWGAAPPPMPGMAPVGSHGFDAGTIKPTASHGGGPAGPSAADIAAQLEKDRIKAARKAFAAAIMSMTKSITEGPDPFAVLHIVFKGLSSAMLDTAKAAAVLLPQMDKLGDAGQSLTEKERAYYLATKEKQRAQVDADVEVLKAIGLTREEILTANAAGVTNAELARTYDVRTEAVVKLAGEYGGLYQTEQRLHELDLEILKTQQAMSGYTSPAEDRTRQLEALADTRQKELDKLDEEFRSPEKAEEKERLRLKILEKYDAQATLVSYQEAQKETSLLNAEYDKDLANKRKIEDAKRTVDTNSAEWKKVLLDRQRADEETQVTRQLQSGKISEDLAFAEMARIKEKYDLDVKMATGSADTIEARLAQSGVFKKAQLETEAAREKQNYADMVAVGGYTTAQIIDQYRKMKDAARVAAGDSGAAWMSMLGGLADAFSKLANVAGGKLATIAQTMGTMLANANVAGEGGKTMKAGFGSMSEGFQAIKYGGFNKESVGASMQGGMGMVQGAIGGVTGIMSAMQSESKAGRVVGGAMAGAQAGAAFGPWGMAVGAVVGTIAGLFKGDPGWAKVQDTVKNKTGVAISEGLAKSIEALAKKEFKGSHGTATIASLDKIIAEAGGLTDQNIGKMTGALRDSFSMLETGAFTVAQTRENLDKNFGLFADHLLKSGKIADAAFTELLILNKRFGTESTQIAAFVQAQVQRLSGGLTMMMAPMLQSLSPDITKGMSDAAKLLADEEAKLAAITDTASEAWKAQKQVVEDVTAQYAKARTIYANTIALTDADIAAKKRRMEAIKDEAGAEKEYAQLQADLLVLETTRTAQVTAAGIELDRASRLTLASFNAAIKSGGDWVTTIANMGTALDSLVAGYKALGVEVPESIRELIEFRQRVTDNKALVESAGAINEIALALSNIGGLTADTLKDIEDQGLSTYTKLTAAGFTETQSLMQMKGWLQTIYDAHTQLGIPIDANTQKLLDQARAEGILADEANSTNGILKAGLSALIKALGGELPEAWRKAGEAAANAARRMRDGTTDVTDGVGDIRTQLDSTDWRGWANKARTAVDDVGEGIDQLNFGSSPGGIKEIPLLLAASQRAVQEFAATAGGQFASVKAQLDGMNALTFAATGVAAPSIGQGARSQQRALDAIKQQAAAQAQNLTVIVQAWDAEDVAKRGVAQIIKALKANAYHQTPKFKEALGLT